MSSSIKYIPGLDLLRAIAVMLVLVHHWMPTDSVFNVLNNGLMGVTLFFVLSGYLISKILFLQKKNEAQPLSTKLKTFYIRRSIRIFPVYYLVIFTLWALGDSLADYNISAYVFYLQNFLFVRLGNYEWPNAHLWSLAVEEQYYLIWPLLVFITPFKHLKKLILVFIAIGPVFRFFGAGYLTSNGGNHEMIHVLTPSTFDCFGLGSFLAIVEFDNPKWLKNGISSLAITSTLFLCFGLFVVGSFSDFDDVLNRLLFSLFSSVLILWFVQAPSGRLPKLNHNAFPIKWILYFGKISYGIYLFHPYVSLGYERLIQPVLINRGVSWLLVPNLNFIILLLLTFMISAISWELFEKPINRLKTRFTY